MEKTNSQSYTFRRMNLKDWRKPGALIALCLVVAFYIFLFFSSILGPIVSNNDYLFLGICLIGLLIVSFRLFTKITISPEGILCKTPLRSISYPWKEIKSSGIYLRTRGGLMVTARNIAIPYEEANGTYARGFVYAWISTTEKRRINNNGFIYKDYFDFDFDDEAWKIIESYIQKDKTQE